MKQIAAALAALALAAVFAAQAAAAPEDFGLESVDASLSTTQAGAHPDLTFSFDVKRNPNSPLNPAGEHDAYATTRNVRFELPPGLVGDPNALGVPQQCTVAGLVSWPQPGGGCPNGSQIGLTNVFTYATGTFLEPVYMMQPPGGDVVARLGFIAGIYPTFIDLRVRSEGDYGLLADITDASADARLIRADTTTWGVPADPSHDTERCRPIDALFGCVTSPPRPPGSRPLPFLTNPTRCGVPLEMRVAASSWPFPDVFDTKSAAFPPISGCDKLPFGPDLTVEPTNHRAGAPTGADITIRLPASDGVNVLEPSQMRDIRVTLPAGMAFNPGAADGLAVCSEAQVHFGERVAAECPDASKMAGTEFDIPVLERRLRGAVYLREPEPGNLFRIWIVADDLGLHVKLPGQLEVDPQTGQITEVTLDVPQAPLREAKLLFKSGFRAPLVNPPTCGEHRTEYEFVPWAGGPTLKSSTPMQISEGCDVGGFSPKLSAGTTDPAAGQHSPFLFTLTREDGEQNPSTLDITLPPGLSAKLAGVALCEGAAAISGQCPPTSRIGKIIAATGAGPAPLWVPQPGKRPAALYLAGPYKGAPLSAVAVVPAQAGPFDLGDVVVRSAIHLDTETAQATIASDPLPQIIEGTPISYRTIHADLDRSEFTLNPTNCSEMAVGAKVTSFQGAIATPFSPFQAANCANLPFKPHMFLRLFGGTHRGAHPKLRTVLMPRSGDANIGSLVLALPRSEFLDQGHIKTVCTRVQFAAEQCPQGSIYGHAKAFTPLLDEPLQGPVYLRSSSHLLPDIVVALHGQVDVDAVGRIDSVGGGVRASFEAIPDAPLEKVVVAMQGGKKGLFINSRDLCDAPSFADLKLKGQNGKIADQRPRLRNSC